MQKTVQKFNEKSLEFLLLTEKAHFFNICTAKKFLNVIFYSLPHNAPIFRYYVDSLAAYLSQTPTKEKVVVKALYSKINSFEVERICGTAAAREMLDKHNKISSVEY